MKLIEDASLKILIIEDDDYYKLELTTLIQTIGYQVATSTSNYSETLLAITTQSPDLIIIDISSKGKEKIIEAARNQKDKDIQILFITCLSKKDFYSDDKKNLASLNEVSLRKAISQTVQTINTTATTSKSSTFLTKDVLYFVKSGVYCKVNVNDILYIKADGDYAAIHTSDGVIPILSRLKKIEQLLKDYPFIQTHRSYLINQAKILAVDTENNSFFAGDDLIPISRQLKKKVLQQFDQYCAAMKKKGKRPLVSNHSLLFI